ncbi:WD40 repeat domain-containing protein [Methanotorris formicicus]|uniref:Serine/threonine protein kinase with WD40 repeats n=1 Tax=Methanotorris formicicus Mc-S-70 TaxID=647171 RepID=H1KY16_9EURY|nr:PQQ-binding-like beta-propeller repeat protein [Methanotorris formicicus]EHP87568.1 serine/threonine protein kinase with WD40 repeats [Methanotorris formicicus Mc-S-70]
MKKFIMGTLLIGIFLHLTSVFCENICGGWSYSSKFIDIDSIAMSEDGKYITAAVRDRGDNLFYICLFNNKGELLWGYKTNYYGSISMTPDGKFIVIGDKNNVYLFDNSGASVWMVWYYNVGGHISSISIIPDGEYILATDNDCNIYFFNQKNGLLWHKNISDRIVSISMVADGEYIFTRCKNKTYLFNNKGNLLWNITNKCPSYISSNGSYIISETFNKSGNTILHVFNNKGKLLWSYVMGNNEFTTFKNTTWVSKWYSVRSIFTSSDDKYIIVIYDVYRGEEPEILPSSSSVLVFNDKGNLLWCNGTYSGNIITAFSMTPYGRYIVIGTGSPPFFICLWRKCFSESAFI